MKNEKPKIDRKIFKDYILEVLDNEGGHWLIVSTIENEIKKFEERDFYGQFIDLCKKYNIEHAISYFGDSCQITILTNGYESYKLESINPQTNISLELSKILYSQLGNQILNKDFVDKVKKNYTIVSHGRKPD